MTSTTHLLEIGERPDDADPGEQADDDTSGLDPARRRTATDAPRMTVTIRLSDVAQPFVAAALDLLRAVLDADDALVADGICEAAERLLRVVDDGKDNL